MTHNKQKGLFLLCLLMMVTTAWGQAEAEYKNLTKSWTLQADGSQEFRYSMELTLFTHTAMNNTYGESFITYNPTYQQLKINASYTKQKDGTIVQTPANAFVEVLPQHATDAPAYNQLKEMVVVHTGLELGATIYLDYTLTSRPGYLPEIDLFETVNQSSPVREYTLTVVTPVEKQLTYTLHHLHSKAVVNESNGMRTTTWNLQNLPAASRAPLISVCQGDIPYLAATTFPSPKEALQTLYKQFNPQEDLQLTTLAESLIDGVENEEDQLKAVIDFTNHQIASNPLTLEETGFRFRSADAVLQTAYGTAAERINLLTGLLRGAGFNARPMATFRVPANSGCGLKAINQLYVACPVNGQTYLLSPQGVQRAQTALFDYTPLYDLESGIQETIKESPEAYQIRGDYQIRFKGDTALITKKESVGQALLPYFAATPSQEKQTLALHNRHGYVTLLLPDAPQGMSHLPYGRLNSMRKENLLISRSVDEQYTYTIELPETVEWCTPVKEETLSNEAGKLTCSIRKEGRQMTIIRSLKLNKQLYTPAEFNALRKLLIIWSDLQERTCLLSIQ